MNIILIIKKGKKSKHFIISTWLKSSLIEYIHHDYNIFINDVVKDSVPIFDTITIVKSGRVHSIPTLRTIKRSNYIVVNNIISKVKFNINIAIWVYLRFSFINITIVKDIKDLRYSIHNIVIKSRLK